MDADYYSPEFLENQERLENWGQDLTELERLWNEGKYGTLPSSSDYTDEGVVLIRGGDFRDLGVIDDENLVRVPMVYWENSSKARANPGDVLLLAKGATIDGPNSVALCTQRFDKALVNGSVFRIKVKKTVDAAYLTAYMATSAFLLQKRRAISNTGIFYNDFESIKGFLVPLPPRPVQEYIGAKVRLAERCRTRARELRREAQRCLDAGVGIDVQAATQITEGKRFRALAVQPEVVLVDSILVSRRLDSAAYSPVRLALLDLLEDARCEFLPIETVADDVTRQRRRYKRDKYAAPYFVSILHLNNKGVVDFHEAKVHNPVSSGIVCQIGDILFSGINPRQNRVAVWTKEGRALCSAEFSIYRPIKDISPFYLAFVWRSVYCLNQLEALTRGTSSSRRRLKDGDFAELLVPVLTPDDQALIARNEQQAIELDTRAAEFVRKAKADVEALIEGRLDVEGIVAGRVQPPTWEDIEV